MQHSSQNWRKYLEAFEVSDGAIQIRIGESNIILYNNVQPKWTYDIDIIVSDAEYEHKKHSHNYFHTTVDNHILLDIFINLRYKIKSKTVSVCTLPTKDDFALQSPFDEHFVGIQLCY